MTKKRGQVKATIASCIAISTLGGCSNYYNGDNNVCNYNPNLDYSYIQGISVLTLDSTSSCIIDDVVLLLKDENNNIIDQWTSTCEPHYINLENGCYIIKVKNLPNNLKNVNESIKLDIQTKNGEIQMIVNQLNQIAFDFISQEMINKQLVKK